MTRQSWGNNSMRSLTRGEEGLVKMISELLGLRIREEIDRGDLTRRSLWIFEWMNICERGAEKTQKGIS